MLIPLQTNFPVYSSLSLDQVNGMQDAVRRAATFNSTGLSWIAAYKSQWDEQWSSNQSALRLQTSIDTEATNLFNDLNNNPTNGWIQRYTESLLAFQFLYGLNPAAFIDAIPDPAGQLDPVSQAVYTRYQTAGWYYTIDSTKPSGIAVTAPIIWTP